MHVHFPIAIAACLMAAPAMAAIGGGEAPAALLRLTTPHAVEWAQATDAASEYYTTPDGCTYRRAQAPGYAPTWHLVLNPFHIGRPNAHKGCKGML